MNEAGRINQVNARTFVTLDTSEARLAGIEITAALLALDDSSDPYGAGVIAASRVLIAGPFTLVFLY